MLLRLELMSPPRASTKVISHAQFTHLSLSIHFVLVGAPSFFTGKPLAIYRVTYSVAALRVDVDLPHSY
jgi:hypothetical protein